MNTVSLAKDPFIRKDEGGGGGGVTINNQEKSLEITENGVTEVTADAGFTGLSKVVVNTNVASSGGGGGTTPDMPVIGDGKTYLYIKIAAEGRMDVPLAFSQTVSNGVTIDWGDGSAPQTLGGQKVTFTHKYAAIGDYVISLNPAEGCTLGLGHGSSSYCVMGSTSNNGKVYCNMLTAVEIGKGATSINTYAFRGCHSLASVVIPEGVTSIGNSAFYNCYNVAFYDFSNCISVPSLGSSAFSNIPSDCKIIVPDALYDTWIAATNWSTYASQIIKKSDWDARS